MRLSKATLVLLGCSAVLLVGRVAPAAPTAAPPALTPAQQQLIAACRPGPEPRVNGPAIIAVRPGTPLLHALAVSGERPMTFAVENLPPGLTFNPDSGLLTGQLNQPGEHLIAYHAINARGEAHGRLTVRCGQTLAWLPPLGWNSYDAFDDAVTEDEVLANARWLKEHLQPLGWDTVVVDFRWYDPAAQGLAVRDPNLVMDAFGRLQPAPNRFPSAADGKGFRPLADQVHALGLKFGIHIMRGIPRRAVELDTPIADSAGTARAAVVPADDVNRPCKWNRDMYAVDGAQPAGLAWYASIVKQYADWGVDYLKADDMSFLQQGRYYATAEIEALHQACRNSGRSIILSLSPGPTPTNRARHVRRYANLWRISSDFWDRWNQLDQSFGLIAEWLPDAGPGCWPDADMIPLGHIRLRYGRGKPDRWTNFTPDEQLTLISLWCLAPSPLMLGMNLPDNDEWTAALLTNPEVLALNQDPWAKAARRTTGLPTRSEVWLRDLQDGSLAVGIFNRSDEPDEAVLLWRDLGLTPPVKVRDLWLRQDLDAPDSFTAALAPHACRLLRLQPAAP